MKLYRLATIATLVLALVGLAGCGGNDSRDTEAPVVLSVEIEEGPADVDVNTPVDVTIGKMTISSQAKSPEETLSQQQDVHLNEWVVTPIRTDGGAVASPQWRNYYSVYVPANGEADLQNYRIFPSDYFHQVPLSYLFPENGGFDPSTGQRTVRQRLHIEVFGKTVAGQDVSLAFDVNLNFFYVTP